MSPGHSLNFLSQFSLAEFAEIRISHQCWECGLIMIWNANCAVFTINALFHSWKGILHKMIIQASNCLYIIGIIMKSKLWHMHRLINYMVCMSNLRVKTL